MLYRWTGSTRVKTCFTSPRTSVSTAAPASRSVPSRRFSPKKIRRRSGSPTSPRTGTCSKARARPASRSARDRETEPRAREPGVPFSGEAAQEIGEEPTGREWLLERRQVARGGDHVALGTREEGRHTPGPPRGGRRG